MKIALTGGIACGKSTLAKFLRELGIRLLDADDVVHELEAPGGAAVPAIVARFGTGVRAPDGSVDRPKLADLVFSNPAARHDLEAILFPLVRSRLRAFTSPAARRGFEDGAARWGRRALPTIGPSFSDDSMDGAARRGRRALPTPDACHDGVPSPGAAYHDDVPTADTAFREYGVPTIDAGCRENYVSMVGADVLGRPPPLNPSPARRPPPPNPPLLPPIAVIPLLFESHWEGDYDTILAITSPLECQIHRMMRTRGYSRAQAEARLAAQMPVAEKAARADFVVVNDSTREHLKDEARRLVAWLKERVKYEQ